TRSDRDWSSDVCSSDLFTGTKAFTNVAAITIPNQGAGTPYPSTIAVSGIGGTISNVTVTLRNLSHTYTRDIDVLLVGPTGQAVRSEERRLGKEGGGRWG